MVLEQTRATLDGINIDLRNRWNKLYDRNPPFKLHIQETLSAEISIKSIQLRNVLSSREPAQCGNAECFRQKRERVHRILIYRRCKMELQNAEQCFPSIWNKPGTSEVIDKVSGEALCHITLLCRDVICETNKCTTCCPTAKFSCDACKMKGINYYSGHQVCGSYAEDCMLPVIYVKNCQNDAIKKSVMSIIWFILDLMMVLKKQNLTYLPLLRWTNLPQVICNSNELQPENYFVGQKQ